MASKKYKKSIYLIPVLIILSVLFYGCPRNKNCFKKFNPFINVTFLPQTDTIKVGDTLVFSAKFYKMVKDSTTGRVIDFSQLNFVNFFSCVTRTTDTAIFNDFLYAMNKFNVKLVKGVYNPTSDLGGWFNFANAVDSLEAEIKLVARDTGEYIFKFSYDEINNKSVLEKYNKNQDCNIKMENIFYNVNEGNNNFKTFEAHTKFAPNYYNGRYSVGQYYALQHSTFTIYVKQ